MRPPGWTAVAAITTWPRGPAAVSVAWRSAPPSAAVTAAPWAGVTVRVPSVSISNPVRSAVAVDVGPGGGQRAGRGRGGAGQEDQGGAAQDQGGEGGGAGPGPAGRGREKCGHGARIRPAGWRRRRISATPCRFVDRRSDYHYDLPPGQIAQTPTARRDASRLCVLGPGGELADRQFPDVVEAIPEGAVVVVNDARVIPARVHAHKDTGGRVELLFLEPIARPGAWRCLARARRPLRAGQVLRTAAGDVTIVSERASDSTVEVEVPGDALAFLEAVGEVPLPPYIERPADAADGERYQTVYARVPGAVAAPTAGLHLTDELLDRLRAPRRRRHAR